MFTMQMKAVTLAAVAALGAPAFTAIPATGPVPGLRHTPAIELTAGNYLDYISNGDGTWTHLPSGQITSLPPSFGNFNHLISWVPPACLAGLPCDIAGHTPPVNPGPIGDIFRDDAGIQYLTGVLTLMLTELKILDAYDSVMVPLLRGVDGFLNLLDPSQLLSGMVMPVLSSIVGIPGDLMLGFNSLLMLPFSLGVGAADATLDGITIGVDIDALSADGSFATDLLDDSLGSVPDGDLVGALSDIVPVL